MDGFGFREPADMMRFLAQRMNVDHYLELGVFHGFTFNQVAPLCRLATAVDIAPVGRHLNFGDFFEMPTNDFLINVLFRMPPVNLALIDADHSHEASLADFFGLLPHCTINGVICLHDTYPASEEYTVPEHCGDSWKTAEYLRDHAAILGVEVVTLPIPHGITIVRKVRHIDVMDLSEIKQNSREQGQGRWRRGSPGYAN